MGFAARHTRAGLLAAAAALLCATTVAAAPGETAGAPAETILVNGHIRTVDARDSVVQALAIRDGRIIALGSSAEISRYANASTEVIDLKGRTATPGLIDSHAHIAEGGYQAVYTLELSDAADIAEVRRRVAARVASLEPGKWLLGHGWDEGKLGDGRYISAADLDAVSPANPMWLEHTTGHYGVANSAALRLAGISAASPDPTAGTIDRDGQGQPTGVLKEAAMRAVTSLIPAPSAEEMRAGILASIDLMHREGMTGVKDPGITLRQWEAYASLAREGRLAAHVCVLWRTDPLPGSASETIARLAQLPKPPQTAQTNLMSCGVKIFMDGSGGARTAWMYQDWNRNSTDLDRGNRGYPSIEPELYREQVRLFNAAGIHVSTHAIGDRAIDWVVDTYAQVLKKRPQQGLRHGIIHANTPTDHAIDMMARLQRDYDAGYPETQAGFTWWIGDNYAGNLGPARAQRLNPYRSYVERGIRWGGGSDYSVTPLAARYGLWASVVRTPLRGTYARQPFGTAQSVDAATALKSYTIWAAHQLFLDHEAGSLEPGKSADIAVWDRDLTSAPSAELENLACELTLFRGRVVHRAAESPVTITPGMAKAQALPAHISIADLGSAKPVNGISANTAFLPPPASVAGPAFEGTLIVSEVEMGTSPAAFSSRQILGKDPKLFPAARLAFVTHGGDLVPGDQGVLRIGSTTAGRSFWDIIVQPGRVWTDAADAGWSRAAFPFALVHSLEGETHNGVAMFAYKGNAVSALRFQIVQQTAPFYVTDAFSAWGEAPLRFDATPLPSSDALRATWEKSLAASITLHRWPELQALVGADKLAGFDSAIKPEEVVLNGLSVGGNFYLKSCNSAAGELAWCERQRFGVWSITKASANAVALLRLAEKYGPEVFDARISDYVKEAAGFPGWDKVTFGDALNMATGLGTGTTRTDPNNISDGYIDATYAPWYEARSAQARIATLLSTAKPFPWGPGKVARYRDEDMFVLGVAMQRYLQSREGKDSDLWTLLEREVYQPIGIYYAPVNRTIEDDGSPGLPLMAYGFYATVDDLLKIGKLFQDRGAHEGKQILHAGKLADTLPGPSARGLPTGDANEPLYHKAFWHSPFKAAAGCTIYYPKMNGWGGNYVMLLPHNMIGLRIGKSTGDDGLAGDVSSIATVADRISGFCT